MAAQVNPPYTPKKALRIGEMCAKAHKMGAPAFREWLYDIRYRFDVSESTLYRCMNKAYALMEVVPSETARRALGDVTGGSGMFTLRGRGDYTATDAFRAAVKAYPVPSEEESPEEWRDWALSVTAKTENLKKKRKSGRRQPGDSFEERATRQIESGEEIRDFSVTRLSPDSPPLSLSSRRDTIHAVIQRDQAVYFAECLELAVVTQGRTLDEVVENLRQALALHLEDEDMASLGLAESPRVQLIYDTAIAS